VKVRTGAVLAATASLLVIAAIADGAIHLAHAQGSLFSGQRTYGLIEEPKAA
jgi:hypothetical protein